MKCIGFCENNKVRHFDYIYDMYAYIYTFTEMIMESWILKNCQISQGLWELLRIRLLISNISSVADALLQQDLIFY